MDESRATEPVDFAARRRSLEKVSEYLEFALQVSDRVEDALLSARLQEALDRATALRQLQ